MNYEIKEILDMLKRNESIIAVDDEQLLLDYITNLQQENERLNNMLNNADNKNLSLIEEINEKQDIIEKAVEYIKYNDDSLYTFETDCDYYEHSSFREDLLNILQNGSESNE